MGIADIAMYRALGIDSEKHVAHSMYREQGWRQFALIISETLSAGSHG